MVTKIRGTGDALTPVITGVDGDSGLFFPVADTVALSTAGVERVRINSIGDVGFGTDLPTLTGNYTVLDMVGRSATNGGMLITRTSDSAGIGRLYSTNTQVLLDDSGSTSDIFIKTNAINNVLLGTNNLERLRIDSAGNVGIGTTTPAARLHASKSYAATAGGISADTVGIFSNNGVANGNANISILSRSSGFQRIYFGNQTVENSAYIEAFTPGGNTAYLSFGTSVDASPAIERARITSGGNLLVGTTTDSGARFQVAKGVEGEYLRVGGDDAGNARALRFTSSTVSASVGALHTINASSVAGTIAFATNSVERARITSSGYFKASNTGSYGGVAGIADQSATALHVFQSDQAGPVVLGISSSTNSAATPFLSALPTGAAGTHFRSLLNNVSVFQVLANGNVQNTNNSYGAISDAKLKENIVPASPKLPGLMEVEFVNFNFKEETGYETHKQFGVIAQQLETVFPGLVESTPDRDSEGNDLGTVTKSVNYSVLALFACKALQEAKTEIDELKARIEQLESGV